MELHVPPLTLTVDQTARLLKIGRRNAYEAVARGEIPSVRIGRRILVPTHRLFELLDEAGKQEQKKSQKTDEARRNRASEGDVKCIQE
jgi:excisionase family DNA binding protein